MSLLRVGCGGWAYFQVPGEESLRAYSRAFDFVELNSTYYELRSLDAVRAWKHVVPEDFEFAVRCNKTLVDQYCAGQPDNGKLERLLASMERTCSVLNANVLAVLVNSSSSKTLAGIERFLSDFHAKGTRVAVELREATASKEFLDLIERNDSIHCVDLSKEEPQVESGVLYARLFGRGEGNVYEFDDNELRMILGKAKRPNFEKSILAFHGVRMYRDAARLKTFVKTGTFPSLTGNTGLDALQNILEEDEVFPSTGHELLERQGWKLIDITNDSRIRAGQLLQKLPHERTFSSARSVRETLDRILNDQSRLDN